MKKKFGSYMQLVNSFCKNLNLLSAFFPAASTDYFATFKWLLTYFIGALRQYNPEHFRRKCEPNSNIEKMWADGAGMQCGKRMDKVALAGIVFYNE